MKTIWKQMITLQHEQIIEIPEESQLISADVQMGMIVVWFKVPDTTAPKVPVKIFVIGTGEECSYAEHSNFVGTVQLPEEYVYHIFVRHTSGYQDHA